MSTRATLGGPAQRCTLVAYLVQQYFACVRNHIHVNTENIFAMLNFHSRRVPKKQKGATTIYTSPPIEPSTASVWVWVETTNQPRLADCQQKARPRWRVLSPKHPTFSINPVLVKGVFFARYTHDGQNRRVDTPELR